MTDIEIVPKTKEEALDYLNLVLKNHPQYESWMNFYALEIKTGGIKVPRCKSAAADETSLSQHEYMEIYREVASQVLGNKQSNI